MIGFIAHYFGWSFNEILNLPINAFFAFYREGIKMEAREYRECLDIAAVPMMQIEYYRHLVERYNGIVDPRVKELPPKPSPVIAAGGPEAKRILKSAFANLKRGMGYGG